MQNQSTNTCSKLDTGYFDSRSDVCFASVVFYCDLFHLRIEKTRKNRKNTWMLGGKLLIKVDGVGMFARYEGFITLHSK